MAEVLGNGENLLLLALSLYTLSFRDTIVTAIITYNAH